MNFLFLPIQILIFKIFLHSLASLKHEVKRVINNQMDLSQRMESIETHIHNNNVSKLNLNKSFSSLNDNSDCTLLMDNTMDFNTFMKKYLVMQSFELIW